MAIAWDKATFDQAYALRIVDENAPDFGQVVHYGKRFAQRFDDPYDDSPTHYLKRAQFLINHIPGLDPTDRLMIVGSGYGFLVYALRFKGYPLTFGIDLSSYLESTFDQERLGDETIVWDDWLKNNTGTVKNKLIAATGDWQFDYIITEQMLSSFDNNELLAIAQACERALYTTNYARIIHIVNDLQPGQNTSDNPLGLRWLTLVEWATLRSNHSFVSSITGDYIVGGSI